MPQALTINIGLNRVDPAHYGGWDGALRACEYDANDMNALATGLGFEGRTLLTKQATAQNVTAAIADAAERLEKGDILFLTYSGHGGQVRDLHGEEDDARDETWVLYDRQLVDDELFALWGRFAAGVRIFVLSDSCHSGSVTRGWYLDSLIDATAERGWLPDEERPAVKSMPEELREEVYREHRDLYDEIERAHPAGDDVDVKAHVLLISGCQDNQESLDGRRNGLFTGTLLKVWNDGRFRGGHRRFRRRILDRMPPSQSPNLFIAGPRNRAFEAQRPLTI